MEDGEETEEATEDLGRGFPKRAQKVSARLLCDESYSRQAIQETEV